MGPLADGWNHEIGRQIKFASSEWDRTASAAGIRLSQFHAEALDGGD